MTIMTTVEPRWLTPAEQNAWRSYLDMNAKLTALLNREIADATGISLADFAVLAQLSEHVDGRMRILELARALGWEKSRLSHQLTRMQQRGLIERRTCTEDRRGSFVGLLDDGRRTIELAAPQHVESVRRYLFDLLDEAQVEALGAIASAVVTGIDTVCDGRAVIATPCGELPSAEFPGAGRSDTDIPCTTVTDSGVPGRMSPVTDIPG